MTSKPKVAVIGTGGTITAIGKSPLDLYEYTATGKMLEADEVAAMMSWQLNAIRSRRRNVGR